MGAKFFIDDVPPQELEHVLLVVSDVERYSRDDITTLFDERGWAHHTRFGTNTIGRMTDLGLLSKEGSLYRLTGTGDFFKRQLASGSATFYDYIHYLHLQKAIEPHGREYFWTYWLLCWYLAERDGAWSSQEAASSVMEGLIEKYSVDSLAIDSGSFGKMLRWVRRLSPCPVAADGRSLVWRDEAPIRPFLLGIDFYYRLLGLPYGYPMLLTPDSRVGLRRVAFVTETGLDRLLSLGSRVLPTLRLHTSVAGVSIILDQPIRVEALE